MGSGQTYYPPAYPVLLTNIYEWGKKVIDYLRAARTVAGGRIRITQSPSGTIISAVEQDAPIGAIISTFADIYGEIAVDGRHTELLKEISTRGWLPCDGATYSVESYPRLAWALGVPVGDATFTVPDTRGRMLMGWDNRGTPAAHSDAYAVQDVGGYRRHGQTENNHHDHQFAVSLTHTHTVPQNTAEICTDFPVAGVCGAGTKQDILIPSATDPDTSAADFDPTGDNVPSGEGSVSRSGAGDEVVTVTLKHKGDDGTGTPAPGAGTALDDADNRPPYMVVNWIIKAL